MLDLVAYCATYALIRVLAALPLGAALALGRALGSFAYHVVPIRRKVVLGNLRHVLGATRTEAEIRRIARDAYRELGMTLVEILRCSVTEPGRLEIHTEIPDLERLRALRAAKTPLIFCFAHSGNFDLVGYAATALGLEIHAVMKPLQSARFNRLIIGARERHGLHPLLKGPEAFLELIDLLEEGKMVALLPDQRPRSGFVTVDFLGKPAATFKGPAILHLLSGAQLVVGVDERLAEDPRRHRVHLTFLPVHEPTDDREGDIRAITQRITDAMSATVLRRPEHYFWFHRRWGKDLRA